MLFLSFFFPPDSPLCPLVHNEFSLFPWNLIFLKFLPLLFLSLVRLDHASILSFFIFSFLFLLLNAAPRIFDDRLDHSDTFTFQKSLIETYHLLILTCFPQYEVCAHFYGNVYLDAIVCLASDQDLHLMVNLLHEDFKEVQID